MPEEQLNPKNEYARHVSLFLAELLRTRRISLDRAAEIAQKVVQNINLIDTEHDFLKFVKELTLDFEELFPFEDRVHLHIHVSNRKQLEGKVRTYAVSIMSEDMHQALAILQEAIRDDVELPDLYEKFPGFKAYVDKHIHHWHKHL